MPVYACCFVSCKEDCYEEGVGITFSMSSDILCAWSKVFESMITGPFNEARSHAVEIRGFSAKGVEAFLRFLYSGVIDKTVTLATMLEIAAIADKYDVSKLRQLCVDYVGKKLSAHNMFSLFEEAVRLQLNDVGKICLQRLCAELNAENACELFAYADRHHLKGLRELCWEQILVKPQQALKSGQCLSAQHLDELFRSPLLCMSDADILELFAKWGNAVGLESVLPIIQPLIEKYVHTSHMSMSKFLELKSSLMKSASTESSKEALQAILVRPDDQNKFALDVLSALHQDMLNQYLGPQ